MSTLLHQLQKKGHGFAMQNSSIQQHLLSLACRHMQAALRVVSFPYMLDLLHLSSRLSSTLSSTLQGTPSVYPTCVQNVWLADFTALTDPKTETSRNLCKYLKTSYLTHIRKPVHPDRCAAISFGYCVRSSTVSWKALLAAVIVMPEANVAP